MRAIVILACLGLSSCVDTSSTKFQQTTTAKCEAFGFQTGSSEMANCRMNLTMMQNHENSRKREASSRAFSEFSTNQQGQADRQAYALSNNQRFIPSLQPRPVVNCVSRPGFGQINTRCQ